MSDVQPTAAAAPPQRSGVRPETVELVLSILSPIVLLAVWEIASLLGWVNTQFFPAPSAILREMGGMIASGELWVHTGASLSRILIGFVIGAVPGVVIGLAMGLSPIVRALLQPLINATFPIPKVAILPLFILMFGLGEASKYAIIAITVVYMALINAYEGVRDIPPIYLDVGHNFGANRRMMFWDVALPGALPQIMAGLKIGMGVALLVIVAAEFVGAKSGIGFLIWNSWQIFAVEKMYVGLMMTALLGFLSAGLFTWLEKKLIPWRKAPSRRPLRARLRRMP